MEIFYTNGYKIIKEEVKKRKFNIRGAKNG